MCSDKTNKKTFTCGDDIFNRFSRVFVNPETMEVYDDDKNLLGIGKYKETNEGVILEISNGI
jgi:hypothetical protein